MCALPGREEKVDLARIALTYGEGRHLKDTDNWHRISSLTRFILWTVSLPFLGLENEIKELQSVPMDVLKRLSPSSSPKKPNVFVAHEFYARLNEVPETIQHLWVRTLKTQLLVIICDVDDTILPIFLSRADFRIKKMLKSFL